MELNKAHALFEESLSHKEEWLTFLKSWCDDKDYFIRKVGFPQPFLARSICGIYNRIVDRGCTKQKPCYMTVYEFRRYKNKLKPNNKTAIRNKLFFDFDANHKEGGVLADAYRDALTLRHHFADKGRLYFTGGRGFHLYVDLAFDLIWPKLPEYIWTGNAIFHDEINIMLNVVCRNDADRKAYLNWIHSTPEILREDVDALKLETLDINCVGLGSQCSRIPYTLHQKEGRFCIPVEDGWSLDKILEESEKLQIPKLIVRKPIIYLTEDVKIVDTLQISLK